MPLTYLFLTEIKLGHWKWKELIVHKTIFGLFYWIFGSVFETCILQEEQFMRTCNYFTALCGLEKLLLSFLACVNPHGIFLFSVIHLCNCHQPVFFLPLVVQCS